jgi:hypothetical protein
MSARALLRRALGALAALGLAALVSGCAHPISLSGNNIALAGTGKAKIDKTAGLALSDDDRKREVITPGGGGDKVSYLPYRDMETGLYIALSESFTKVVRVSGPQDPKVKAESVHYVVTPQINTTSYSPSLVTWPPTIFTVELICRITDGEGKLVTEVRAAGDGRAEFDEFKNDFSLAAKRAADDALAKLVKALGEAGAKLR